MICSGRVRCCKCKDGHAFWRLTRIWPNHFKVWPDGPGWRVEVMNPEQSSDSWYSDIHEHLTDAVDEALERYSC
jgi:hypothetical protein